MKEKKYIFGIYLDNNVIHKEAALLVSKANNGLGKNIFAYRFDRVNRAITRSYTDCLLQNCSLFWTFLRTHIIRSVKYLDRYYT